MTTTTEKALGIINGQGKKPLFVNVNNRRDYHLICKGLFATDKVCLSSYFIQGQLLPEIDRLIQDISVRTTSVAVLGLTQYLAFKDEEELAQLLVKIAWANNRIVVICYQVESILTTMVCSDIRLKDRVLLVNGVEDDTPTMNLSPFSIDKRIAFANLRDYFKKLEDVGGERGSVVSTIQSIVFEKGIWKVTTIASSYEALCLSDPEFQGKFPHEFGTDGDWSFLHDELSGGITLQDLCRKHFGTVDLSAVVREYRTLSTQKRWLLFIALKQTNENSYVGFVAKQIQNMDDTISKVYCAILDINVTDKSFIQLYNERKNIIKDNMDPTATAEFCNLANNMDRDKVLYLTDLTEQERKEVIKCICEYKYTNSELSKFLPRVYPLLADYLEPYYFGKDLEFLTNYFEQYKAQKIRNQINPDFIENVNEIAKERPYNALLAPRTMVLKRTDDTILLWVDALGVEFLSFIMKRCEAYGLKAYADYARAKLPTLTHFNKEFYEEARGDTSVKDLDELKHKGKGDYDYSKSPLPLYITHELDIIDSVIQTAKTRLTPNNKVVIVSDHGASRLSRIRENIITVEAEVDAEHGGRCCKWKDGLRAVSEYVTDEENGYCVIANYDRFKGGKYTGVEMHGGATLEEVVIPIITLTLKTVSVTAKLKTDKLKYERRRLDPLVVTLSNPVSKPRLRIEDKFYDAGSTINNTTYSFELDIKQSGKYKAVFLDDNQEVANITFEVKSATGSINDIL